MLSNSEPVQSSQTFLRPPSYPLPMIPSASDLDILSLSMVHNEYVPPVALTPSPEPVFTPETPETPEEEFFDLKSPAPTSSSTNIEDLMKRLFSAEHLHYILEDHSLFYKFSSFLNHFKPNLVPTLVRYLEMRKAMKAIEYANAVARSIRWPSHTDYCKFSQVQAAVIDTRFGDYASRELLLLCTEALPAFVTHTLVDVVVDMVGKDITGQGVPALQGLVGNLAEIFCLTDPAIHDNPIIYASEEFHRTTQYGTTYAIDRNCRFLQGPYTDKNTTSRLAEAIVRGQESNEILLNYRRDGTPFVNLLMCAPLYDDKGVVRYFIGAQVDVSGLIEEGRGIESFARLLQNEKQNPAEDSQFAQYKPRQENSFLEKRFKETLNALQELGVMFSRDECEVVNRNSRTADDQSDTSSVHSSVPTSIKNRRQSKRVIGSITAGELNGPSLSQLNFGNANAGTGSLPGVYKHYLLVRPYPSLQIIFVSPALRLPGLLRTRLFSKLGGSSQTISALEAALRDGASVTAKVLWLPKNNSEHGRTAEVKPRWIRCTPLLGSDDRVGVWMIILVPVEGEGPSNGYGYRHSQHEMVDEMESERNRSTQCSRAGSRQGSVVGKSSIYEDGGFGLRRRRMSRVTSCMGAGEEYAQFLRSSSSTGFKGVQREGGEEEGRMATDLGL